MATELNPTERVRISTGLKCNASCVFCYYNHELNTQDYSTVEIKRMLDIAWRYNIKNIDFSGGEPTIRTDFVELVTYAKEKGFQKICAITNGIMTARIEDLKKYQDAGLNEILLSIHGHCEDIHNALTRNSNSFSWLLKTLENVNRLGIRLRTNTVITQVNYKNLINIADIILPFKPRASNFICFNDWVNASPLTQEIAVKYSEVSSYLCDLVNYLDSYISKVTVRYIPFCFMPGYEKHACGLLQNFYDNDEWIDSVKRLVTDINSERKIQYFSKLNDAWQNNCRDLAREMIPEELCVITEQGNRPFTDFPPNLAHAAHKIDNYLLRKNYVKGDDCCDCAYNKICDGLEKSYANIHGTAELKPFLGEIVSDPMKFRRDYTIRWE